MKRAASSATPLLHCRDCPVRLRGVCRPLGGPGDLEDLQAARRPVRIIAAGGQVYGQGEPVGGLHNLLVGWIALYQSLPDGRRQILSFALPGAVIGVEPGGRGRLGHGAVALTDVAVCTLPSLELEKLRRRHRAFGDRLLWLIERDEVLIYEHLMSLGRRTAEERLAALLVELWCRVSLRPPAAGVPVVLPIGQADLADALGLTAVHVSRTLSRLRRDRLLTFSRGRLTLHDPAAVVRLAGVEAETIALCTSESAAGLVPGGVGYWLGEIAAPMGRVASGRSSNS